MTKVDVNIALKSPLAKRYDNYIGGEWRAPNAGKYFDNISPDHRPAGLRDRALRRLRRRSRARRRARRQGRLGPHQPAERAQILNKIADRMEANLEMLATAETWDNGKPIRETMAADLPLAIDHFRYFAGRRSARRKVASARSTTTPSPITSTSRSAWSARSFRGTSRS